MLVFFLPIALVMLCLALPPQSGLRERCVEALVLFGTLVWAVTELLSVFDALTAGTLSAAWLALALAGGAVWWRRPAGKRAPVQIDWLTALYSAASVLIFSLTLVTALASPPNSADAMAYHMPRVLYWSEQHSVRIFPTPYLNQVMLQPFAEYLTLNGYVVSGGDRFANLGQWLASVGCAIGVSLIAKRFGAGPRAQALAALFSAALPSGILASSGAKNDYVLSLWLTAAVYFALRGAETGSSRNAALAGCASGLALLTKATAYLFAPWPLALLLMVGWRRRGREIGRAALLAGAIAAVINLPFFARNYRLSGAALGFESAFAKPQYRWRNNAFGWKQTVSNALRHWSEQMGGRSEAWNRGVFDAVIAIHRRLGIAADAPVDTWEGAVYSPPRNANHEADAPNRLHLAIYAAIFVVLLARALRGRDRLPALYAASLVLGFGAFCFYLKWQPFMARLLLPLFVLAAPLAFRVRPAWLQVVLCLALLDGARRPVLDNWVRPLRGPKSVLAVPRDQQYFADMTQWRETWPAYEEAISALRNDRCNLVAVDITRFQLEYPLEAMVRERRPEVQFVHKNVAGPTAAYAQPVAGRPCAQVCLGCGARDWVSFEQTGK